MATYIKTKMAQEKLLAAEEHVRETVASIIADVAKRGDAAVRETSHAWIIGRRLISDYHRRKSRN